MAFEPTHVVPQGGVQAWTEPDPAQAPATTLSPGVELRLLEERGAWGRVEGVNGWTGWVDARRLVAREATVGAPVPGPGPSEPPAETASLATPPGVAPAGPSPADPGTDPGTGAGGAGPEATAAGGGAEPPGPSFVHTHVVPQGGLTAWGSPDGSTTPIAELAGGTQLRLVERLGGWAKVEGSNGWEGWVDASRLVVAGGPLPVYAPQGVTGEVGTPRSIGTSILLFIVTFGIYGFFWTYKTHEEIKRHSGIGMGGGLGLVVYIFAGIVTPFLIANDVGQMYERNGWQAPVRAVTGAWILLPIAGAFVWFFKVQGALNDFWVAKGAPPA